MLLPISRSMQSPQASGSLNSLRECDDWCESMWQRKSGVGEVKMANVTKTDRDFKRLPFLISKGHSSNYVTHWFISPEAKTHTHRPAQHTNKEACKHTDTHTRPFLSSCCQPNDHCFVWKSCLMVRSLWSLLLDLFIASGVLLPCPPKPDYPLL